MRRQLTALTLAAALAPALAACGGGDSPSASSSSSGASDPSSASTSASATTASGCDDLLSQDDAETAAGTSLSPGKDAGQGEIQACQWQGSASGVQVLKAPADQWAQQLPQVISQYETPGAKVPPSVQAKLSQGLKAIAQKKTISADQACGLFAELSKIPSSVSGSAAGTITTVLPSAKKPQAVAAQACTDGTFEAVTVAYKTLPASKVDATVTRTDAALATLQG